MYAPRRRPRGRRAPAIEPETIASVADSIRLDALRRGRKLTQRQVTANVERFLKSRYWRERRGLLEAYGTHPPSSAGPRDV
jgi:hypothetical protein